MDVRSLRYFVEVARQKSFTVAAQKLFITQPTLSRQIAELEEELGQRLFSRTTRKLELTEKGVFLFQEAQNILALIERTKKEAMSTKEIAGDLVICAAETPVMEVLALAIKDFLHEHPNVHFHFLSENAVDAANHLRLGNADFAVFIAPTDTEDFTCLTLPRHARWGVLARRDAFADKVSITPKELSECALYIPRQRLIQNVLSGWLGFPFDRLRIVGTYNLIYNASLLVRCGAMALAIEGIVSPDETINFYPLEPTLSSDIVFAWSTNRQDRTLNEVFIKAVKARIAQEKWS